MTCADCRAALSVLLDGEEDGGLASGLGQVESHLARCGDCREWLARARTLQAMTRSAQGPSAEWSERLVAWTLGGGEG